MAIIIGEMYDQTFEKRKKKKKKKKRKTRSILKILVKAVLSRRNFR